MPQNVFVGDIAKYYDSDSDPHFSAAVLGPTAAFLADLAGDAKALEFAIGTGRVALPLRERGVEVHGLEISEDMVAVLRAKPGGADVPVTIGDMAATRLNDSFALVYLVFNTISNLLTQAEQVACFRNAAAHLEPGGCFVVELGIPQVRRVAVGESAHAFEVTDEHLGFDTYDFAEQRLTSHHYWFVRDQMHRFDSHHRYAWPAELDLMAQLAGLRLRERWADWDRSPFTGESTNCVSVWELPERIFHIAAAADWQAAQETGAYRLSTRGQSLADVGFIHCSYEHQVRAVASFVYADVTEPLVVLEIDVTRIAARVAVENLDGGDEVFPHIYGELPVGAVVATTPTRMHDGQIVWP